MGDEKNTNGTEGTNNSTQNGTGDPEKQGQAGTVPAGKESKAQDWNQKTDPVSFDDFLKAGNQPEFDRRVNNAVQAALSKQKQKLDKLADDRVSEAEKLAVMNEAERTAYRQQKKEKELAAKEALINKRELEAQAKNELADRGLPKTLAALLDYTDADACKKSIDVLEEAFGKAVQAAVSDRLKGGSPMKKAGEQTEEDMRNEVARAIAGHI